MDPTASFFFLALSSNYIFQVIFLISIIKRGKKQTNLTDLPNSSRKEDEIEALNK